MSYKSITISIDNKRPTLEEKEVIESQKCIRCGENYDSSKRTIFVNLGNKLLWWHGLKKIGFDGIKPICDYILNPPRVHKQLLKLKKKCATCEIVLKNSRYFPYCSEECKYRTIPRKPFLKEFLEI